jgi:hypothetical protein
MRILFQGNLGKISGLLPGSGSNGRWRMDLLLNALFKAFPNLRAAFWQFISPKNPIYNCIAWAAEETDCKWWPWKGVGVYWPPGVREDPSVDAFVEAYGTKGYTPCGMDACFEPNYNKVALYAKHGPSGLEVQHAARQLANGCWTSKLGDEQDIEHHSLQDIEGPVYGRVVCILRRSKPS